MPRGMASSKQLAMMTEVLDAYCAQHHINDPIEKDKLATRLLGLFDRGARTRGELAEALARVAKEREA